MILLFANSNNKLLYIVIVCLKLIEHFTCTYPELVLYLMARLTEVVPSIPP